MCVYLGHRTIGKSWLAHGRWYDHDICLFTHIPPNPLTQVSLCERDSTHLLLIVRYEEEDEEEDEEEQ
jgi:hypothetical protein